MYPLRTLVVICFLWLWHRTQFRDTFADLDAGDAAACLKRAEAPGAGLCFFKARGGGGGGGVGLDVPYSYSVLSKTK